LISLLSATPLSSPLFVWSNSQVFTLVNKEIFQTASASDLSKFLTGTPGTLSSYLNDKESKPELVVLFIQQLTREQFDTFAQVYDIQPNGGSFKNLKGILENAASSVIFPYASTDYTQLAFSLKDSVKRQPILVRQFESMIPSGLDELKVQHMNLPTLKARLTSEWEILKNKIPDLLIVSLEGEQSDEVLADVMESLQQTKYVAAFLASSGADYITRFPDTDPVMGAFEQEYIQDTLYRRAVLGNSSNTVTGGYWPDSIVQGLLVSIPFLIVLSIGVHCAFTLQSGLKFDAEKKLQAK